MAKFGFIGMGNMGYAMLKGLLSVYTPSDIIFTCPDLEKCKRISQETGVRYAESNAECANSPVCSTCCKATGISIQY